MDKESNLADHGVRKYENEVGVFTSIDPLWEQYRSWSPYHYAGNNPIMALDWNGKNIYSNEPSQLTSDLNSLMIGDIEFYYNEIDGLSIKDLRKRFFNPKEINTQTIFFDKIINTFNEMISSPNNTYIKYVGGNDYITTLFDEFFANSSGQLKSKVSERGGEITYPIGDQENDKIIDYKAYGNYIFLDKEFLHPYNSNRIVNLSHGIGHVIHDGKSQGGVIDFENLFRKSFYINLELRDYDAKHPE